MDALVAPDLALKLKEIVAELDATVGALHALCVVRVSRHLLEVCLIDGLAAACAADLGRGVGRMSLAVKVALGREELLGGKLHAARLALEVLRVVPAPESDGSLTLDRLHAAGALVGVVLGVALLAHAALRHFIVLGSNREGLVALLALEAFRVLMK